MLRTGANAVDDKNSADAPDKRMRKRLGREVLCKGMERSRSGCRIGESLKRCESKRAHLFDHVAGTQALCGTRRCLEAAEEGGGSATSKCGIIRGGRNVECSSIAKVVSDNKVEMCHEVDVHLV